MPTAPETKTRKFSPLMSFGFAVLLAFVHVFGYIVLAFIGNQSVTNVANVFGVLLGTVTLATAFGLWKKSWTWAIVSFIAVFCLNALVGGILLLAEPWLTNLMYGFAILIMCPFTFGFMLASWPAKTTVVEVKKVTIPLESVPAPVVITDPELVRTFARFEHRLALMMEELNLADLQGNPMTATELFVAIEARFASLFDHFTIVDDTNTVLPLREDHE